MKEKIAIIAGHGAGDPGAVANGYQEQALTRWIAEELKEHFHNCEAVLFDTSKNYVSEIRAGRIPNFTPYDYVLEVHMNASTRQEASGTMLYIDQTERGHSVEDKILQNMQKIGFAKCWDGVVVTQRQFPSGLIVQNAVRKQGVSHAVLETCFITNKGDLDRLTKHLDLVCEAVSGGVEEGFGYSKKEEDKSTVSEGKVPNMTFCGHGVGAAAANVSMNVRSDSNVSAAILGVVYPGQVVEILERLNNGWIRIVWPGAACGYAYTSNAGGIYYREV